MRRYAPHHTSVHTWPTHAAGTPRERALSSLRQLVSALVSLLSSSQLPKKPSTGVPVVRGHPDDDVYAESRLRALKRWLGLSTPLTPAEQMSLRMMVRPNSRVVRSEERTCSSGKCRVCAKTVQGSERKPQRSPWMVGGDLIWPLLSVGMFWIVWLMLRVVRWFREIRATWRRRRVVRDVKMGLEYVMANADCYSSWHRAAGMCDEVEGRSEWKKEHGVVCGKCGGGVRDRVEAVCDVDLLVGKLNELGRLYRQGDVRGLAFALRASLIRNWGGMCHPELHQWSRVGTHYVVEDYVDVVSYLVAFIGQSGWGGVLEEGDSVFSVDDKLTFLNEARHAYGRSALMLSGGAAMGLNHLGVVKALLGQGLMPKVVCGTSAGALVASMVGIFDDAELAGSLSTEELINPLTGRPFSFKYFDDHTTVMRRLRRFFRKGYIQDVKMLQDCLRKNFGDLTFEEAYNRTRRILNITVCPLRSSSDPPLLLNYLTAPHVLIWSAAAASCALPLVFAPVELVTKSVSGRLVPYHPDGVRWIDGSISSDVPLSRIGELFNVNHFIVSQTNPHVIPRSSPIMQTPLALLIKSELQFRYWQLLQMGLVPKLLTAIFPHFMQPYAGDVTIMPDVRLIDIMRLLRNPSPEVVGGFMRRGQLQTYPFLDRIRLHCLIERTLDLSVETVATAAKQGVLPESPRRAPVLFGRVPSWLWLDTRSILGAGSGAMSVMPNPFAKRVEDDDAGFESDDESEDVIITRTDSPLEGRWRKRSTGGGGGGGFQSGLATAADEFLEGVLDDLAMDTGRESTIDRGEYRFQGLSDGSDDSIEEERVIC